MKNIKIIIPSIIIIILSAIFYIAIWGCATPEMISTKTGTQLWTENCQRCHNIPPPNAFNKENWEVIGMHMEMKAHLTEAEKDKIVDFLKAAN
ncbi:MAG: cytochrome c [Bacteroidota bacterium]